MFSKKEPDEIIYSDINSKKRRELITNKLFEFNQAQSEKVIECDRLKTDSPTFIEIYAEAKPQQLVGGLISYID